MVEGLDSDSASESDLDSESALAPLVTASALASEFQTVSDSGPVQSASGSESVQSASELAPELESQWDSDSATALEFDSAPDSPPVPDSAPLPEQLLQYPLLPVYVFVCLAQRRAQA